MRIAVYNGKVMAFKYQSTSCEEIDVDVPKEWIDEPIFTESNQNRFKVVNGVVVKKTEEELKAEPEYVAWAEKKREKEYIDKTDKYAIKAIWELLEDSDILAKLSSKTAQGVAIGKTIRADIKDTIK